MSFVVRDPAGAAVGDPYSSCADAAQDAEHLHAETGRRHTVVDGDGGEVMYESKGPPADDE